MQDSTETKKTKIKMRTTLQHGDARCVICRNGRRNSLIIWWAKKLLSQVKHPEAFLVDGILRNLLEKWYRVSTGFSLAARRTEIELHGGPKFQGALCRRRIGNQVLRAKKFGDLNDSRSQSYRRFVNLETISGLQSWYKVCQFNGCIHSRNSFLLTILLNLAKPLRIILAASGGLIPWNAIVICEMSKTS